MLKAHLLTALIGLSLIGALCMLIFDSTKHPKRTYLFALFITLTCLALGIVLLTQFDLTQTGLQFQARYLWIKAWNIYYSVGIDGISLSLILLTLVMTLLVIISTWHYSYQRYSQYLASFLCIQGLMIGSLCATDAILFYIFWEALLIPIALNIGIWGSQQRAYAATKFFIYTFLGSALMLIALLYLGSVKSANDFSIQHFYTLKLSWHEQILIFTAFLLAFGIKIPMWPVHTWLPDAHTESSGEGSVVLAALMLKLGAYGLLRFCFPITPDAAQFLAPVICTLSGIVIIYAGLIALMQTDIKKRIAYSSIAQMSIVVLGLFLVFPIHVQLSRKTVWVILGWQGAMFHMIAHAISTAGLFFSVNSLYQRFHTRDMAAYQGLFKVMPTLAGFFMLFILSSIGLPGMAGFVGEFLVIASAVQFNFWLGFIAAMTLVISASYMLILYGRLFWGELKHPVVSALTPLYSSERLVLYCLGGLNILFGIYPVILFQLFQPALENILKFSLQSKL